MQLPLQKDANYVVGAWPCVGDLSVLGLFDELCRILPLARFYEVIYKFYLRDRMNVSFATLKSRVKVLPCFV